VFLVLQWAPGSASVAVGSRRSEICLWNIETGALETTLVGHTKSVYAVNYGGSVVVSGSADHFIKVGDHVVIACVSADVLGCLWFGQIWDTRSGECTTTFGFDGSGHSSSVLCVQNDGAYRVGTLCMRVLVFECCARVALRHRSCRGQETSL
jgi:WD40 repeat protein